MYRTYRSVPQQSQVGDEYSQVTKYGEIDPLLDKQPLHPGPIKRRWCRVDCSDLKADLSKCVEEKQNQKTEKIETPHFMPTPLVPRRLQLKLWRRIAVVLAFP